MKLRELYPYWMGEHEEFLDSLEMLTDEQWQARFNIGDGLSIRFLLLDLIEQERFWINHIAQGQFHEPLPLSALKTGADILDEYLATRAKTIRYIETLTPESLRTVRVAPDDAEMNEVERNVPLGWILWHVVQRELSVAGQVRLLKTMLRGAQ